MLAVLEARRGTEVQELGRFPEHWVLHEGLRVAMHESPERWDAGLFQRGEVVWLPAVVSRRLFVWHAKREWPQLSSGDAVRRFADVRRQDALITHHQGRMESAVREGMRLWTGGWAVCYRVEGGV